MRDSFIFYRSFYDSIKELGNEDKALIYDAIFEYALNHNEVSLKGFPKALFTLILPQLEANYKRYIKGVSNGKKGADFGSLGGRPKKESHDVTPKKPLKNPQETPKETPKEPSNVNENVNENENENDFFSLWDKYPNKQGKQNALKKYLSLSKKDHDIFNKINIAIKNYKDICDKDKRDMKYILHGDTFFNGRWEDYLSVQKNDIPDIIKIGRQEQIAKGIIHD